MCASADAYHNEKQVFPVDNAISGFTVWLNTLQQARGHILVLF